MGYIEELAARDAARQEQNRVKAAEASRVLNQGTPGLAGIVADPYVNGISQKDIYRLAMAERAARANEYGNVMDMITKNRDYIATKRALDERDAAATATFDAGDDYGGNSGLMDGLIFDPIDKAAIAKYKENIDQGLAAKWMESYKGRQ